MHTSSVLKEGHFRGIFKAELGRLVQSVNPKKMDLIQADQVGSPDFCYLTYFFIFKLRNGSNITSGTGSAVFKGNTELGKVIYGTEHC